MKLRDAFCGDTARISVGMPRFGGTFVVLLCFVVSSVANGEKSLQGRSVDTRIEFEVLENQPIGSTVGVIPIKPNFTYRFNEQPLHFALNATTGVITTTSVLDRESLPNDKFDFVILSSLPTYPIEVRVTVLDVNDNAPTFPESSIAVSFSESATAGTRVILDTATDGDIGPNDVTTDYQIVTGPKWATDKFRLVVTTNPSGETPYLHLESTGNFDRETQAFYQLNISARDGGEVPKFGYLLVNVTILDVNDNPPIFDHSDYVVSLNESVAPGTRVLQVTATDVDEGDNSRITYFLSPGNSQFSVDPDTGEITTSKSLDCDEKSCVFTVFARDHGSPRQDGRTYVTVNLLDTNDHDPIIRFRYFPANGKFATVDENAQNGSVVAAVSVIDLDEGPNGDTRVEIKAGNERNHFKLDSTPSFDIVRVNAALDREKVSRYNLTIMAEDNGTPKRTSTAFLIIQVNDINDHEPVFEKSEYSATFSELAPVGTYVAGITATDEDTGVNSNIYYSIVSGNDHQWFDIDNVSGLVTTRAKLDRELQDTVTLKISARDGGPSPKWAYTSLKIQILDENDEPPVFEFVVTNVTLSESTASNTVVASVIARDEDQGTNGTVTYSLHSEVEHRYPGMFAVGVSNGRVTTRTKLDREAMPFYELKVLARDQGVPALSSTATIYLSVEDVNDNSPEFYPRFYFFDLKEELGHVHAFDRDEGKNAEITYFFVQPTEDLLIEPKTGEIRLTDSGKAKNKSLRVIVSAKDAGNRKALEDAVVHVLNPSATESIAFESDKYVFSVTEDSEDAAKIASTPREIGRVKVVSSPSASFYVVGGDEERVFEIRGSGDVGVLESRRKIDRENKRRFDLDIVAFVAAMGAHAVTRVTIVVADVNDNAPFFGVSRAVAYIDEDAPIGHEVYLARAEDQDEGVNSELVYELSTNPGDMFYMSATSGMIHLKKRISFDGSVASDSGVGQTLNRVYNLEVTATDGGSPALNARQFVNVFVQDVNDHTPAFAHNSFETLLLETTAVNTRFFSLTATDVDLGVNSAVEYKIVDGNEDGRFGIFPDGMLFLKRGLDRETTDYYGLSVVARDNGVPARSSSASVVIRVIDENDNKPVFSNETFNFYLRENESIDTFVGRLTATDADIGRNSELFFSITSSMGLDFTIDSKSGVIKTLKSFDREQVLALSGRSWLTLDAAVADNGVIRLQDVAQVLVHIVDVNDNAPQFPRLRYKANVHENAEAGTKLLEVSADDDDEGRNGRVSYSLVAGNEDNAFQLDSDSGSLSLRSRVDRETRNVYELTVEARDDGNPRLSSSALVRVNVLDVNDNAPRFVAGLETINVSERAEVGRVLTKFEAVDDDLGMNRVVKFHISDGNAMGMFLLDADTGVLTLGKQLDFERETGYSLNVTVSDSGHPKLHTWTMVEVKVQDANDNPPLFSNTAIVRQIEEGIPVGTPVVTVLAEDPDAGRNGQVVYAIARQAPGGEHFGINPQTGVLFTQRPIDRESEDNFRVTVVARDLGEPVALESEKLVTIIVEDVNDNAPVFTSLASGVLVGGTKTGSVVFQVTAKDMDASTNGLVTYELVNGADFSGLFSVDRATGRVTVTRDVVNPRPTYELHVRATDEAVQSQRKSTETRLTLIGIANVGGDESSGGGESGGPGPEKRVKFAQPSYSASVEENETVGATVVRVVAKAGEALGQDVEYHLVDVAAFSRGVRVSGSGEGGANSATSFAVDRARGAVVTAAVLDREAGVDEFRLKVLAVVPSPVGVQTAETTKPVSMHQAYFSGQRDTIYHRRQEHEFMLIGCMFLARDPSGEDEGMKRAVILNIGLPESFINTDVETVGGLWREKLRVKRPLWDKENFGGWRSIERDSSAPPWESIRPADRKRNVWSSLTYAASFSLEECVSPSGIYPILSSSPPLSCGFDVGRSNQVPPVHPVDSRV
ncbi:unnamed protein product [Notodromas monacha]|uniref:Cadherin domain-containing protein n=1 Tax=Notodromas monacha TaxID=399045 RepID=A0A7R9G9J1_9CRUS|nr:unnamed protein product [Notodromas monacha]CAG0913257.1 unnamed protein product [Notodromas monacha]